MKRITIFIIITLLNLLLFEFVLSLFDPEEILVKSFDSQLLYAMYPNKKGKIISEEFSVVVETNDQGFRQKKITQYEGIVLGDSFSEGWGVEEQYIYVNQLNDKLEPSKKLLNLGMHGSSPILFALQLEHFIKRYSPKKVIIQLFDNDLDDNEKLERFIEQKEGYIVAGIKKNWMVYILSEKFANLVKESTLYRLFQRIIKSIKKEAAPILYYKIGKEPKIKQITHQEALLKFGKLASLENKIKTAYNGQFAFYEEFKTELWQTRFKKNESYLQQIISICKKNNVSLHFLYIPAKEFFAKGGITGKINGFGVKEYNAQNPFFQQIERICIQNNLQCIYGNELLFNQNPEDLYFPFDAHLNSQGHKILSNEIYNKLYQ